jgi:hypothetical protein
MALLKLWLFFFVSMLVGFLALMLLSRAIFSYPEKTLGQLLQSFITATGFATGMTYLARSGRSSSHRGTQDPPA